ncbi:MAG: phosphate ABC transporter substrate-binding protein [bacterium]|nr:phosphate ABC transporter substrate-binding protein [bacterium]
MQTTRLIFIILTLTVILYPLYGQLEELELAGSTTVQKRILEPAADAIAKATNLKLTIRGNGSGHGFKELMAGKIKASIASSPLSMLLKKNGLPDDGTYQEHVIYKDIIVPVVHTTNPVSELTFQQLSDINTGKITNWKEVGGEDRPIHVVTSHLEAATRMVFQKVVMNKQPYVKNAKEVHTTRAELSVVMKFKGCIGAVSEGFIKVYKPNVKVIKTNEISRPLEFVTKGNPTPEVDKLIKFLKTAEAQKLIK